MIILMAIGFAIGYFVGIPFPALGSKYIGLAFLALLDSLTFSLARDFSESEAQQHAVYTRLIAALAFGGFIIYFGEKTQTDLYLVVLVPLGVATAFNLYKFLPK
jgi:small basic protein